MSLRLPLRPVTLITAALILGGCASTPFVLPPVPLPQLPNASNAPTEGRVFPGSTAWPDGLMAPAPSAQTSPVPSSQTQPVLPPAAQVGVPRARFGLRTVDCTQADGSRGVYVYKLLPGSPLAGSVEVGDRITRLQGVDVSNSASLTNLIASVRPLTPTQMTFVRQGNPSSVSFMPPSWVPNDDELAVINQPITTALAGNLCRIVTRVSAGSSQQ